MWFLIIISQLLVTSCFKYEIPVKEKLRTNRLLMGNGFGSHTTALKEGRGSVKPGVVSPPRVVPDHIPRPDYASAGNIGGKPGASGPTLPLNAQMMGLMREAGVIAREVLDAAINSAFAGATTDSIDVVVHDETIKRCCYPSPLGYNLFPKSTCTSLNEVLCHGIPDSTILQEGDILNIDVTVFHRGLVHADCSETIIVKPPSTANSQHVDKPQSPRRKRNISNHLSIEQSSRLLRATYDALQAAIRLCGPGIPFHHIGGVIEKIANERGCISVPEFAGHGVHTVFHADPTILHFANKHDVGVMQVGHTFTIEPIFMLQGGKRYPTTDAGLFHREWEDGWTAVTLDGRWAAQFEHTLCVVPDGVQVLTAKLPTSPPFSWEHTSS